MTDIRESQAMYKERAFLAAHPICQCDKPATIILWNGDEWGRYGNIRCAVCYTCYTHP